MSDDSIEGMRAILGKIFEGSRFNTKNGAEYVFEKNYLRLLGQLKGCLHPRDSSVKLLMSVVQL